MRKGWHWSVIRTGEYLGESSLASPKGCSKTFYTQGVIEVGSRAEVTSQNIDGLFSGGLV